MTAEDSRPAGRHERGQPPAPAETLISVVIPAYNAAATIGATLRSVQAQTHRAIEVLVVDDGSTDDTGKRVAEAARDDPRIRLLSQPNSGPATARNRGIAASSASLVAPIDADDLWHPRFLELLMIAMADPGVGFAYAPHRIIDEAGRILRDFAVFGCRGMTLHRLALVNFVGTGSAAIYRSTAIRDAGGFDSRTFAWGGGEDYLLQIAVASRYRVALVPCYLVGYRRRAGSLSSDPQKAKRSRLRVVEEALTRYPGIPRRVWRWNRSDACRVAAIQSLRRGRVLAAMGMLSAAMLADPAGTLWDGARRLRNAMERGFGRRRPVPQSRLFEEADPKIGAPPDLDRLTRHRLAMLRQPEAETDAARD